MTADNPTTVVPTLRFPEFQNAPAWPRRLMSSYLSESRIKGNGGHKAKKLSVKLWGKGVVGKNDSVQGSANTQYYRRHAGQFIYSKLDFLNQAFGIIPVHLDGFESTLDLPCFDVASELNSKFLLEYVQREQFYKTRGEIADGGRKAKRIQVETFLECPIYAPSGPEQNKIANCLSSLDDLIAAEDRKLEALRQHKEGLMQQLFPREGETVPQLRFPEFQDAPVWIQGRCRDIANVLSGYGFPEKFQGKKSGQYPFYKVSDISRTVENGHRYILEANSYIDAEVLDEIQGKPLPAGTIIFAKIGEAIRSNRRVVTTKPAVIDNNTAGVSAIKEKISDEFLFYLWSNVSLIDHAGGVVPAVSKSALENVPLCYPTAPEEQQHIAECLSTIDTRIGAQVIKLSTLCTHKQGLLQQLFPSLEEESR